MTCPCGCGRPVATYKGRGRHPKYAEWTCAERWRRRNRKRELARIKLARGCERCGLPGPALVLDFHHPDPRVKDFTIGEVKDGVVPAALEAELAKCEVLCACCHRIVTYEADPESQVPEREIDHRQRKLEAAREAWDRTEAFRRATQR